MEASIKAIFQKEGFDCSFFRANGNALTWHWGLESLTCLHVQSGALQGVREAGLQGSKMTALFFNISLARSLGKLLLRSATVMESLGMSFKTPPKWDDQTAMLEIVIDPPDLHGNDLPFICDLFSRISVRATGNFKIRAARALYNDYNFRLSMGILPDIIYNMAGAKMLDRWLDVRMLNVKNARSGGGGEGKKEVLLMVLPEEVANKEVETAPPTITPPKVQVEEGKGGRGKTFYCLQYREKMTEEVCVENAKLYFSVQKQISESGGNTDLSQIELDRFIMCSECQNNKIMEE